MSIESYVYNLRWLLAELRESLSEEEISELKDDISAVSPGDWLLFVKSNLDLIQAFQSATPSRRRKLKKFQKSGMKSRLVLASAQRVKSAIRLLELDVESHVVGLSYRDASVAGADCYDDLTRRFPSFYWPFDNDPPKYYWCE